VNQKTNPEQTKSKKNQALASEKTQNQALALPP